MRDTQAIEIIKSAFESAKNRDKAGTYSTLMKLFPEWEAQHKAANENGRENLKRAMTAKLLAQGLSANEATCITNAIESSSPDGLMFSGAALNLGTALETIAHRHPADSFPGEN